MKIFVDFSFIYAPRLNYHFFMRFLALLLIAAALPAVSADRPEWSRLTTPHFELYTTAGEKKGREAILYFEQVRSFFNQAAPLGNNASEFPVRIIVFRSEKQYRPYSASSVAFAYYTASRTRDYIVLQDAEAEHFPAAIHEYMHLMAHRAGFNFPVWLNEGWADLYSTLKPMGKKSMIGDLIPGHVQTLAREKWLDLETLTSVNQRSPEYNEKNRVGIFYAESWALVHMLYLAPDYQTKFNAFVNAILRGQSVAEACQTAYGRSSAQIYKRSASVPEAQPALRDGVPGHADKVGGRGGNGGRSGV